MEAEIGSKMASRPQNFAFPSDKKQYFKQNTVRIIRTVFLPPVFVRYLRGKVDYSGN